MGPSSQKLHIYEGEMMASIVAQTLKNLPSGTRRLAVPTHSHPLAMNTVSANRRLHNPRRLS